MKVDVAAALDAAADALYEATPYLTHVDLLRERTLDAGAATRRAANRAREEGQTEEGGCGPNGWE